MTQEQEDTLKTMVLCYIPLLLSIAFTVALTQHNRDEDRRRSDALIQIERVTRSAESAPLDVTRKAMPEIHLARDLFERGEYDEAEEQADRVQALLIQAGVLALTE